MSTVLPAVRPSVICTVVFSLAELAVPCHFCLFLKQTFLARFWCEFPACLWLCLCWWVESAFLGVFSCRAQPSGDKSDSRGFGTRVHLPDAVERPRQDLAQSGAELTLCPRQPRGGDGQGAPLHCRTVAPQLREPGAGAAGSAESGAPTPAAAEGVSPAPLPAT